MNGKMPIRPRQHELETISRRVFEGLLPYGWTTNFATVDKEYGIDGEVGVFEEGKATGLSFKVQLKATDDTNEPASESISIKSYNYCDKISIDIPVLMVLYHAETNNIYVKWFHEFDPYYDKSGKKANRDPNSESIAFYWFKDDLWIENSISKIKNDLEIIRKLKTHQFILPFSLKLNVNLSNIRGISIPTLSNQLNSNESLKNIFEFKFLGNDNQGEVYVDNEKIEFWFYQQKKMTFHIEKFNFSQTDLIELVMLCSIRPLINIGLDLEACSILSQIINSRFLYNCSDFRNIAFETFIRNAKWECFSELFDKIIDTIPKVSDKNDIVGLIVYLSSILIYNRQIIPSAILSYLQLKLDNSLAIDDESQGHIYYNQANMNKHDCKKAFSLYNKARKFRPKYLNYDYFLKEVAGALFHLKRYKLSATLYEKAYNLKTDTSILPLYADALLFSGKYEKSLEIFVSSQSWDCEWKLKMKLLNEFIVPNKKEQKREILRAKADLLSLYECDKNLNDKIAFDDMKKVLNLDFLNDEALFSMGLISGNLELSANKGEYRPYQYFLLAYFANHEFLNYEALGFAFIHCQQDKEVIVGTLIMLLAIRNNFHLFYSSIEEIYRNNMEDETVRNEMLLNIIKLKEDLEKTDTQDENKEIRLHFDDGEYINLYLK